MVQCDSDRFLEYLNELKSELYDLERRLDVVHYLASSSMYEAENIVYDLELLAVEVEQIQVDEEN